MTKYRFGKTSMTRLNTCHTDLRIVMNVAIVDDPPFDFSIVCGERLDEADQEAKFDAGYSRAHFGESPHNYSPSLAVDAIPYVDGKGRWSDRALLKRLSDHIMAVSKRLYKDGAISRQVKWGGNFTRWYDGPHYVLIGWKNLK